MNIDYFNLGKLSVKGLIIELQKIVDDNPHINFHKVGVGCNEEYDILYADLKQWEYKGKQRFQIDLN